MTEKQLLPIGTLLQNRYRVERQLSSGGFGNTYVVRNINFDERWAMKEFFMKGISERDGQTTSVTVASASKPQFEAQRDKFNKEARRLRRLRHPGIVHVEDLFDDNCTSYYIMDYIGGGSLADAVKQSGPLTEARVRQLLPMLLDALEYVHNEKMWHLDLKPGNILLDDNGHPVLIDFGASKQLGVSGAQSTSTGMTYTQGYAPSEQVDQNLDRIGPWTDLYALGATLYNLLSGQAPPLVSEIQESEAEAFAFPSGVSKQMRQLVVWMMSPNRRKRPQSVAEVRDFLQLGDTMGARQQPTTDDATRMPDDATRRRSNNLANPASQPSFWHRLTALQKGVMAAAGAALVAVLLFVLWPKGGETPEGDVEEDSQLVEDLDLEEAIRDVFPTTATDKPCTSPLGDYTYTGPVDAEGMPHGMGSATFDDGRSYDGPFEHGTMQGKDARFRMQNGDVFTGEFRDNRFYNGRYTVKDDGSYFQGTFKNGQPDKGNWYDKTGKRL
ncbi:MAG: protein kinase [Bacteroidaceae bacterium]|nr:protein kinase [Bacteroidaceae bacterium]